MSISWNPSKSCGSLYRLIPCKQLKDTSWVSVFTDLATFIWEVLPCVVYLVHLRLVLPKWIQTSCAQAELGALSFCNPTWLITLHNDFFPASHTRLWSLWYQALLGPFHLLTFIFQQCLAEWTSPLLYHLKNKTKQLIPVVWKWPGSCS